MIVNFDEALKIYNEIPSKFKSFYYHPEYIEASAKESTEFKSIYFVQKENDQIFYHAALIGKISYTDLQDIQTPYGYGGPLIIGNNDFKERVVQEYRLLCEELNILVEFIRFHPVVANQKMYYGEVIENRSTVAINLNVDDIFKSFSTRVKTAIRAAQKKNIKIVVSKDKKYTQSFYSIYTRLMLEKQTSEEYFFSEKYIQNLLDNDNVYLLSAVDESGQILGGSLFMIESEVADYHLSATTETGRISNVSHLLLYEFAILAKGKGAKLFYLGGGTENSENNSLLFFKKGFSKQGYGFFIGYTIFKQQEYDEYKQSYFNTTDSKISRILFYR